MTSVSQLYEQAQRYLPGGVSATARANAAIGHPLYVSRGDGPRLYDVEGREYIDMCMSHGASLLGHNHPRIKAAVAQALEMGILCSARRNITWPWPGASPSWCRAPKWCGSPVRGPRP